MNRADGYTTDVNYPAFFYKEMSPVWLACMSRLLGFGAPDISQPFSYCELGCGPGVNVLVAAACHPHARFVGVDFNEQHLRTARNAAAAAGLTNIEFVHGSFPEFAARHAASFDFIATHGVWSWIAPQHQDGLLACVDAGLKPGGLFYLHYMCHPGSTDLLTVQHFLNLFAPQVPGSSARQVQMGLKLLGQLAERGLFVDQPRVLQHLENLRAKDPNHLAHEFLTDHWRPQHSVDVHQQISTLGLGYLGSADVFNNLDVSLSVPGKMQVVIRQTKVPALAETLKDMARHSHQRMDLFQRQPQPLGEQAYLAQLGALVFRLSPGATATGPITFTSPIGPIEGPQALCTPLLQRLAVGPVSFDELSRLPAFDGKAGLLLQTVQLMLMQEIVHPVNPCEASVHPPAQALTRWFGQHGLALQVSPECGTAVRSSGRLSMAPCQTQSHSSSGC